MTNATRATPPPPLPAARRASLGGALAIGSGLAYAVTVVIGRELAERGINSPTALGLRFGLAALLLLALQAARRGPLLPAPGERLATFLLGAIGYGIESSCFYAGLERGTAAAVGLLFYSYPAIVTVLEIVTGQIKAERRLFVALALSVGGVALVVGTGERVTITPAGAVFAVLAALTFSLYFLGSHRYVKRTVPGVTAIWVSAGASCSILLRGILTTSLQDPSDHWVRLLTYALANCFAFALMFAALRLLGPSRTAVLLTVEVLGTVVLAAIFLGETLRAVQLIGGAAIAAGAVLTALAQVEPAEPAPP